MRRETGVRTNRRSSTVALLGQPMAHGCLFLTIPPGADNSNFPNFYSSVSTARAQDGALQTP